LIGECISSVSQIIPIHHSQNNTLIRQNTMSVKTDQLFTHQTEAGELSDMTLDDRLESLYRENVKISEEVSHIIDGNSDDMSLLDSIKILAGLREASEESLQASRSHSSNSKGRNATLKRKAGSMDVDDEASGVGSPRPGPRQSVTSDRLAVVEGKSRERNRERSVTSTREVSVKLEDGAESVASSVEGNPPSPSLPPSLTDQKPQDTNNQQKANEPRTSRLQLSLGAHVFYRNKGRTQEGEGILCRVTNVIGEGKQRRYEIQDADPDPVPGGELPPPYRASVAHLMPIPTENKGLADLNKGRHVLAQYPVSILPLHLILWPCRSRGRGCSFY
jgi:SAGA-associated factor 29